MAEKSAIYNSSIKEVRNEPGLSVFRAAKLPHNVKYAVANRAAVNEWGTTALKAAMIAVNEQPIPVTSGIKDEP